MGKRKYAVVEYSDGHTLKDGVLIPTYKTKEIMLTGTKRFHDCLHLILGLNRLERMLIDWLSEEMNDENIVRNDVYVRKQFIEFVKTLPHSARESKEYKDQSVSNAFSKLVKKGLIERKNKMYYEINPAYYWRGSDNERIDKIMMNIQFHHKDTEFKVYKGSKYRVVVKNDEKMGS